MDKDTPAPKIENAPYFAETLTFMASLRKAQAQRGKPLAGLVGLTTAQRKAATHSAGYVRAFNRISGFEELDNLMIRFIDMARRNEMPVDPHIYPTIAAILQHEWVMNVNALELDRNFEKLIPLTLYHGTDFATAPHEPKFKTFADTLGIFRQIAIYHPVNPRKHLRSMIDTIKELKADDEFAEFRATPSIFREAVLHLSSKNAHDFLRKVKANIERVSADPRFKQFEDSPSIYRYAAKHNVHKPEEFLLNTIKTIRSLESDPELKFFAKATGIIKHAAIHHPNHAREFLLEIKHTATKIEKEEEFKKLARDHQGIIKYAVCFYRQDPRAFLRKYETTHDELCADPEYRSLRPYRWAFKYAARNNPKDPHGFMNKVLSGEINAHRYAQEFLDEAPQP